MSPFKKVVVETEETVEEVLKSTKIVSIPKRGLRLETCEHFGIRTGYNVKTGAPQAHYFPVLKGKEVVGFIKRRLDKAKKGAWSTVGDITVKDQMFGQDKCKYSKKIWVVEGVYDAPSAWQSLYDNQRGEKKHIPNVVSITMGTKNALANITHNKKFLDNYSEVILAFDNDMATEEQVQKKEPLGQDAAKEVCLMYPDYKTICFPEEVDGHTVKDASDLLVLDSSELFRQLMFKGSTYSHDAVYNGCSLSVDQLSKAVSKGFMVEGLPETMRLLHGLRDREMTILLAPPKCFGEGTPVRMGDGTVKAVEDVRVGDYVLGVDGRILRVDNTVSGHNKMWLVEQSLGLSYVVSDNHDMVLYDTQTGCEVIMEVRECCHLSRLKGKRVDKAGNTLLSSITLTPLCNSKFYGFSLEGEDKRFLLEDGTIVHNCGKTTLCKLINYRLLEAGIPTLGIYLEEDHQKTVQSFIALDNNVHLPSLRENPNIVGDEAKQKTIDKLLRPDMAYFYNGDQRKLTPDGVIDTLLWASSVGIKRVILDHLSYVFSGNASTNERKDIDLLLTEIADVVRTTGIHPIVVSHIGRKPKNPPTVKGEIQYPWWYTVDESDARGSGAFEQIAWNMIAIEKQITEDRSRGLSRTKVLLNREWDWCGIGDTLTVDQTTGWMKVAEDYYD